ncbi:protein phosphatase 1 regulatory subunit 3F [Dromiciops gliroides]|uniref:protein phosphatase 1 regulatory subunit 3F n=1 Tax=Dromiciops gliroides TaxID=33562 RepID=UPI001CC78664|nr:protein phosphatase 1 regulatory subunit 3F [Dromiciops gliroides]
MARAAPRGEPPNLAGSPPEAGPPPPAAAAEEPEEGPGPAQALPQPRPPGGGPRRVLFADEALGLPLAQLRRYQPWDCEGPEGGPDEDDHHAKGGDDDDDDDDESPPELGLSGSPPGGGPGPPFYLLPGFALPPAPGRLERLRGSMVELEDLLPPEDPGTPGRAPVLRGLIRVLNLSYHKAVHVRATHDGWLTFHDHPAHYVPRGGSSPEDGGQTDRFAFQLPFEPPSVGAQVQDGARIDFVVRYQTPEATYWANNQGKNYTVVLKETAARAKGLGLVAPPVPLLGPPPPPPAKHLFWEVEAKQLKSCMKPGRHRQTAEELRRENLDEPVSSMECPDDGDRGSGSILVTPLPLQPGSQIIQVSDVPVASSPENKGCPLYLPETFLECPQPPTMEIHPSGPSLVPVSEPEQGRALGVPWSEAREEARALGEWPFEGSLGKWTDLLRSDEAQTEDAVDLELEQLYLTHLSRLRDSGGIPLTDPDQELFLKWMGPERALNSSLAEEITLHYAMQSVQGVPELLEDAKDGAGSSGGEAEGDEEEEEAAEGDTLKESPPGIGAGVWLAGQHPGFVLVKDGLIQDPEEEEILGSGHSWSHSWAAPEQKPEDMEKEHNQIGAIKAEGLSSCFQEESNLLPNSIPVQKPTGIAQGGGLWEFPGQLHRALSQSLCVLGLLVFLPIVWNACMAFMGLAIYLSLAWFS